MDKRFPAIAGSTVNHKTKQPARTMSHGAPEPNPKRAAAFSRRSMKHPQISIGQQMSVISKYAKRRGLVIVKEYADGLKGDGK
jgi:hypothetical protein